MDQEDARKERVLRSVRRLLFIDHLLTREDARRILALHDLNLDDLDKQR